MKTDTLYFTTSEVQGAITGGVRRWQAFVQNNGVVDSEQFSQQVAAEANRAPEDVNYVRSVAKKTLVRLLRQGYVVNVGDISYMVVIIGSFSAPDAEFTPGVHKLAVVAIPRGKLKACLGNKKLVNLIKQPNPRIDSVIDSVTQKPWELTVGHTVYIAGRNLAPDRTVADERVWLEDPATGAEVKAGTITASDLQTVNVTFAEWPDPGAYRLCLATRSGFPDSRTLVTVRKDVTVVAATEGSNE